MTVKIKKREVTTFQYFDQKKKIASENEIHVYLAINFHVEKKDMYFSIVKGNRHCRY